MATDLVVERAWNFATLALLVAAAGFVLWGFNEHGISNDEPVQRTYGELLLDFYSSGFADRRAFGYINLYYYGGLFDMAAAWLQRVLPMDAWDLRHLLTGLCGLSGMVATALLTRRLAGARSGFFSLALLALTGAWTGTLFTHTKDIPFAAAMMWSLYGTTLIVAALPRPGWRLTLGTGLAIGCALGMRIGGLFALVYLGVAVCCGIGLRSGSVQSFLQQVLQTLPRMLALLAVTIAVMAVAWPWSMMGWGNVIDAATKFSHFSFDMLTVLDGNLYKVGDVPGSYLSLYLLVRLPELMLVGVALALALLAARVARRTVGRNQIALFLPLALAAGFPVVFSLATAPALYNGMRHFTFVVPALAAVAALGLDGSWDALRRTRAGLAAYTVLLLVFAGYSALTLVQLHPYEYLSYNRLTGGVRGAQDRWETDYWGDSLREAIGLLNARIRSEAGDSPVSYSVAFCAEPLQASTYLDPRLRVTRNWPAADFFVTATHINCDSALAGTVIAEVRRAGVTFAVVKDRRKLVGHERHVRNPGN